MVFPTAVSLWYHCPVMPRSSGGGATLARNAGLTILMLAALAVFFTLQGQFLALARREPLGAWAVFATHLTTQLGLLLPWAILVPVIGRLARVAELGRVRWPRVLIVHAGGCALATVLVPAFYTLATPSVLRWFGADPGGPFTESFAKLFRTNALTYFLIVGFWVLVDYYRRFRERERAATALEAQLAEARLQALRAQVHPHFLFNALHAVSSLVHTNPDEADRMIGELSELLRASLHGSSQQEVPLRVEVQTLQHYLEIMKVRFKDRLRIHVAVPPEAGGTRVPAFLLQPLVENAVKHGVGALEEGGTIEIEAWRDGDRLAVRVRDTGDGFADPTAALPSGHGLAALRDRLCLLYGAEGALVLANGPAGGAAVTITLPWRTDDGSEAGSGRPS
jgi:signal transduction histidine kinase